jgi:hypothetical protein
MASRGHDEGEQAVSIYGLLLPGWEELSTWGVDDGYLYAQLTRNGRSDDDGPEVQITPPGWPVLHTAAELSAVIARVTGAEPTEVLAAMTPTVSAADRRRLGLPDPGAAPPGRGPRMVT